MWHGAKDCCFGGVKVKGLRIVILGSGPVSFAAAAHLVEKGFKPTVIDVGLDFDYQNKVDLRFLNSHSHSGEKTWFGSSHSFLQPHDLEINYSGTKIRPSYGLGGFSRVWGATLNSFDDCAQNLRFFRNRPSDEDYLYINRILPSLVEESYLFKDFSKNLNSSYFKVLKAKLSVSSRHCKFKQSCVLGCPNNAIWSSGDEFMELVRSQSIDYLPNIYVKKITEDKSGFLLQGENLRDGNTFTEIADYVILGCGAISTGILLVRSGFYNKLTLKDSNTRFGLLLDFRPFRKKKTNSGTLLSKVWIKDEAETFMIQVYESGKPLIQRLKSMKILNTLIINFLERSFILNRLFPVIIYSNTKNSGNIEIVRESGTIVVRTKYPLLRRLFEYIRIWQIRIRFLRTGIFLSPLTHSRVGTGYHFGAAVEEYFDSFLVNKLKSNSSIVSIDAISLADLPVGGIVYNSMVQASSSVRKMVMNIEDS